MPAHAEDRIVSNQEEYAAALDQVGAGDTITLANGEWRDFEIVITGQGTADAPITLTSETPGGVILTGQSNLRIGGEHIVVSGLVFRDGFSPTGEVVSFRRDSENLARNSRVTQTVIDNFSKLDRTETDYWVAIYGQNNRFDHNHLVGKTNRGVTLAVRLNTAESRQNNHRIDHNYFGPRPNLGSNGGETLRIGTSHYAEYDSNTVVENNVFDRTDGEVEIISSKSGGNTFRENLFLHSRGALTLRHGDGNLVERNVFLGDGKDHTGGIRVINRRQIVRDNYMEGLRGDGFASALTVMNGVPNSPANRYVEVQHAQILRNSIIDSDRITFGAGADEERSAAPSDSYFYSNLLGGRDGETFLEVDADISGIALAGNAVISGQMHSAVEAIPRYQTEMERADNGLLYPVNPALANVGAPRDLRVMALDEVGVDWYPKPGADTEFGAGSEIAVEASAGALLRAINGAADGDTLLLAPGNYDIERTIPIYRTLTIAGAGNGQVTVTFARPSLFEMREGGRLRLANLLIDGANAPDSTGNAVIRTASVPIRGNLQIELDRVIVRNLDVNRDFDVIYFGKSTLADRVDIRSSIFENVTGSVVSASSESDDQGRYNVEYLDIRESIFRNLTGPVARVYRGGRDESTFGPHVDIAQSVIENVGSGAGVSIALHGAQRTNISENAFMASAPIGITHTVGTPVTAITGNAFERTSAPELIELVYPGEPRVEMSSNVHTDGEGA
ncbi:polysaccharide lyase 6 family protein [Erythrobacter alti]|uniref:polysaccharide lyase 6 family protein n=1 Tax=Erythrobacter alti TaxID=1896145 RepID=UPI0030F49BB6